MLCGLRIKPAEGLLLDMPAKKPRHEILGEESRAGCHLLGHWISLAWWDLIARVGHLGW